MSVGTTGGGEERYSLGERDQENRTG